MQLADLVSNASDRMKLDIQELRIAASHNGLKGTGAEEILAEFLRDRLPGSLGVTTGQVVDRDGNLSKQADVIVYDATRTPMLFKSAANSWDVIPAEGVLAVIEVKMHLKASDLQSIVDNCSSVLSLHRDAYIGPSEATFAAHGTTYTELPIYYSLFAFESDAMYGTQLTDLQKSLPLGERISSACYLDRGASLYFELSGTKVRFSATPTAPGTMLDISESALLAWFVTLTQVLFQASLRPIDLASYASAALTAMPAAMGQQSQEDRLTLLSTVASQAMAPFGIPPDVGARIGSKVFAKQTLDDAEIATLRDAGIQVTVKEDGTASVQIPNVT